jgi:hypothetical protein
MYLELKEFAKDLSKDRKPFLRDGELGTSLLFGVVVAIWCHCDPTFVPRIRSHFGDLLTVVSIIFGFVLTTMFFHVEAAENWGDHPAVLSVASRLVLRDVFAVFSFLVLLMYIVALWAIGGHPRLSPWSWPYTHGTLAFLSAYSGLQIVNQTLTLRWAFMRRHVLKASKPPVPSEPPSAKVTEG